MVSVINNNNSKKRKDVASNGTSNQVQSSSFSPKDLKPQLRVNRSEEHEERESIVLWKQPMTTIKYFVKEVSLLLSTYGRKIIQYKEIVFFGIIFSVFLYLLMNFFEIQQPLMQKIYKKILWCLYWMGLGILSSVGLGTGLHTFLLYLGPHIAQVTLAAYECESLNFPEPPYPDDIICPSEKDPLSVTVFSIMSKVRLEAMCWGAGTALGELPPYFMARAARLSGIDPDESDDLKEFELLQNKSKSELTYIERGKLMIEHIVQKVGFFGILACASIPNPLFDLAGITCGHFLVPFWTFFGATLIGKAIIKMHIQKLFVIIAFNENLIENALDYIVLVPIVGKQLQTPLKLFLNEQKMRLHNFTKSEVKSNSNILSIIFEMFVVFMILYFIISIINSFAQNYHKRLHKKKNK